MESVRKLVRGQWDAWLDRRIPARSRVTLTQKRIFILPTWMGMGYLLTTFLLFVAGVNYDNSMILNFSFFLGSLFVVSILQTFSNVSGMVISAGHTEPAFCGSEAKFVIHLEKSRKKEHHSIFCSWCGYQSKAYNLIQEQQVALVTLLPTQQRGRYRPGRFKLHSIYPFGLCQAWTWVDLDMFALVYPRPIECELNTTSRSDGEEGSHVVMEGQDDFAGLRAFNPSDSLKTVDWKAFARRNVLYTKQFQGYQAKSAWLRWNEIAVGDVERRLSGLCYWVLQFSKTNEPYGLELPGVTINPGVGKQHEENCLTALAEYRHG
ncbi:MAG: DUF58 domain-containing protein [Ketobacter sp.]|nr:MAG: DUF58 domain-containing protein [Ketobacter sp.]